MKQKDVYEIWRAELIFHWAAQAMLSGAPWPRLEECWCFPMELLPLLPAQSPAQIFPLPIAKQKTESTEGGLKRTK